jgi:predicted GIY-YIG superfamily endonuclease
MGGLFCTENEATLWTVTTVRSANTCGYWKCDKHIRHDHFLCTEHWQYWQDRLIDQCPNCHRFKPARYELCLDCKRGRQVAPWSSTAAIPTQNRPNGSEHSDAWKNGDREGDQFFVYILKLDDGEFYVGHTNDLRARLSEHRDRKTVSTAGRNPRLGYFEMLPSREAAKAREAELKRVYPRQKRRMVIDFADLVGEIQSE